MSEKKTGVDSVEAGKQEYIWKGPLGEPGRASKWYYVTLVVIALVLGAIFFLVQQPLTVIVIAAALMFFLTHAAEQPKVHRYQISDGGVAIEDTTVEWDELKTFWIVENDVVAKLYAERIGRFALPLSIPLQRADSAGIRALVRTHLPESKQRGEPLADVLARLTGIL